MFERKNFSHCNNYNKNPLDENNCINTGYTYPTVICLLPKNICNWVNVSEIKLLNVFRTKFFLNFLQ